MSLVLSCLSLFLSFLMFRCLHNPIKILPFAFKSVSAELDSVTICLYLLLCYFAFFTFTFVTRLLRGESALGPCLERCDLVVALAVVFNVTRDIESYVLQLYSLLIFSPSICVQFSGFATFISKVAL